MESLELDMVQYDCPYIDTTRDYDITFFAKQWDFNPAEHVLETRIMARGADSTSLHRGMDALSSHPKMNGYDLLNREEETALIRSQIDETNAMRTIRDNNGYITGPFIIRDGSERWHVGFDKELTAGDALSELDKENDYSVRSREAIDLEDFHDLLQNAQALKSLLDGLRDLSTVERRTLLLAVSEGYFTTPRDATLGSLAAEFDVSKNAVSKNLRRSQRKLLHQVSDAMDEIDETDSPLSTEA